jgi:uncharacterized membrane protein YhaH (DUF805 family)
VSYSHNLVLVWIAAWLLGSIPAFVIGIRSGVASPIAAFIPIVGPIIVLLHSIKRSGWLCLLALIPLVGLIFAIWLVFVLPREHGRTGWWTLFFLIPLVNLIAYYAYAFSLDPSSRPRSRGGLGSTYHVPPGYKQQRR